MRRIHFTLFVAFMVVVSSVGFVRGEEKQENRPRDIVFAERTLELYTYGQVLNERSEELTKLEDAMLKSDIRNANMLSNVRSTAYQDAYNASMIGIMAFLAGSFLQHTGDSLYLYGLIPNPPRDAKSLVTGTIDRQIGQIRYDTRILNLLLVHVKHPPLSESGASLRIELSRAIKKLEDAKKWVEEDS